MHSKHVRTKIYNLFFVNWKFTLYKYVQIIQLEISTEFVIRSIIHRNYCYTFVLYLAVYRELPKAIHRELPKKNVSSLL